MAAQACLRASEPGFFSRRRRCAPSPTAPEETIRTSRPCFRSVATDSMSPYSLPSATAPSSRMMTFVPAFTTIRRASADALPDSSFVHPAIVGR